MQENKEIRALAIKKLEDITKAQFYLALHAHIPISDSNRMPPSDRNRFMTHMNNYFTERQMALDKAKAKK